VGELCDGRGHLKALVKDNLLALEADVFGPLDEAGEIACRLDVLAYVYRSDTSHCSLLSQQILPIPKFLGRDSKSGFLTTFCVLETPAGARAGFFGGW